MAKNDEVANNVNVNWNLYKRSVTQILPHQGANATTQSVPKSTTKEIDQLKKQFESMASDLPGGTGYLAICEDTEGNLFGIIEYDRNAK